MTGFLGTLVRLLLAAAIGVLFGTVVGLSPAAREPGVVWIGQFAAPWLAVPWLVGWGVVGRRAGAAHAVVAGALASAAAVHGYYLHWWEIIPAELELPAETSLPEAYLVSSMRNLQFATIWYAAGVVSGAVMAVLGWRYRRDGWLVAGAALAVPFILEPVGQFLWLGRLDRPEWVWVVEALLGLALLAWMIRRGRQGTPVPAASTTT